MATLLQIFSCQVHEVFVKNDILSLYLRIVLILQIWWLINTAKPQKMGISV